MVSLRLSSSTFVFASLSVSPCDIVDWRRSLLTQGKEVEENDADSWRHGSLHAVDERAQRHTRRGAKDAHLASLDEGLARELRDHTRCSTRVQCQGRGRGLEKSNINCEELHIFTTK